MTMAKKILVVDDEPFIVQMVSSRLKANGYEVISAADGEEGLRKAQSEKPDLIILDVMMPKMDGFQVCATLKQDERFRSIPILIFTAKGGDEARQVGLEDCGANDYVSKPLEPQSFLAKVAELVGKK